MPRLLAVLALALVPFSAPATAQERTGVTVTLGLGARLAPDYFGASDRSLGPTGSFSVNELVLPGGLGFGTRDARPLEPGFGFRGGFRYIGTRSASSNPELAGLDRIGSAVELGGGLTHATEFSRVYAEIRRGFGGHRGWVGEVGADAVLRPAPGLVLTAGPRALWGDRRFTRTYFGVTPAESLASGLAAYAPSSGLVSVGAEVAALYDFGNGWGMQGALTWDRLRSRASASPITRSRNQYGARLVLTRRFTLGN